MVFTREAGGLWASDDQASDAVHTEELLAAIQKRYAKNGNAIECFLSGKTVTYAIEAGTVSVKTQVHAASRTDGEENKAELGALIDALGIPKSKRKPKLRQALQFSKIVEPAIAGNKRRPFRVLDLACGRSYLGFVLVHQAVSSGLGASLHGVESDQALVDKCREVAKALRWTNCTFERADLAQYSATSKTYDVVVSLHGCDTLTDDAIRIAWEARSPFLFVAPCCQHELRHLWQTHPLRWVSRYGLVEQRLADALTDGYRCLVLEALGYRVKVVRFVAPDISPKNLLIQAQLVSGPKRERADTAWSFSRQFGVRLKLAVVLESAGMGPGAG